MNVAFEGGTLKALADSSSFVTAANQVTVTVAAKGGTIDANGKAVTIPAAIHEDPASTGGALTFVGGGKVTFSGAVSCAVTQDVGAGTIIGVTSAAKSALFSHLTVAIPASGAADGTVVVESADSAFNALDVAAIALSGNDGSRYRLALGA